MNNSPRNILLKTANIPLIINNLDFEAIIKNTIIMSVDNFS